MLPKSFMVLLHSKGYTEKSFAKELGISSQIISLYNMKKRMHTLKSAYNMAKVLDISLDELAKYFI